MVDSSILRARFMEVLLAYDFSEEVAEELVDELVPEVVKVDMESTFDAESEEDDYELDQN
jgi:hypothetical protein